VSLFHLPLAQRHGDQHAVSAADRVLAALFLRERLGPARWIAIRHRLCWRAAGRPAALRALTFNGFALLCPPVPRFLIAVRDLVTRRVHAGIPSILITLSTPRP
jgi:hypothetical protein